MFTFTPFALPWAIVALALFALAGVIYCLHRHTHNNARQKASRVAVLFCATIALVGIWFSGFAVMLSATDPQAAARAARVALAGICFLPAAIYDFTATALVSPGLGQIASPSLLMARSWRSSPIAEERRTCICAGWIVSRPSPSRAVTGQQRRSFRPILKPLVSRPSES